MFLLDFVVPIKGELRGCHEGVFEMNEDILKFLLKSLERSSQAVFFFRKDEKISFLANKQALNYFDRGDGIVELEAVFGDGMDAPFRDGLLKEQLEQEDFAFLYNVHVQSNKGIPKLCDIQIAYADEAKESFFVELYFKEDKRMDMAMNQVKFSQRAEGILNFDEKLSLVVCNEPFRAVFEPDVVKRQGLYGTLVYHGFQTDVLGRLMQEIHENLNKSPHYMTEIKVNTSNGEEKRYSLELQRRTLDETGVDKVMAYMVNIENIVELEAGYDSINRQFQSLQELSDDTLFLVKIPEKRWISRDPKLAELGMKPEIEDFPEGVLELGVIHPADREKYREFARSALGGRSGEAEIRLLKADESVQYRKFLWTAVKSEDSVVTEVIGKMMDIQELVDKQHQLEDISQYFKTIHRMFKGLLYRFDIKNRILYRNEETAKLYHVPAKTENYPPPLWLESIFHPEDVLGFQDFIDAVVDGREGTHTARLRNAVGDFQYHIFTFKALRSKDGVLREMIGTAVNVHELKEKEQELKAVNQHFTAYQKLSEDLLFRVDIEQKLFVKKEEEGISGNLMDSAVRFPEDMLTNGSVFPEDASAFQAFAMRVLSGVADTVEVRMKLSPEEPWGFRRIICTPVVGHGKVKEMVGKLVDVQVVKEMEEKANYDALTNTFNKRALLEYASDIIKQTYGEEKHALFFLVLEDFKEINDKYGQTFGDYLLSDMGRRLKDSVRSHDLVGRVGGNEFVVFLRDAPSTELLLGKAKRLLATVSEEFSLEGKSYKTQGSLGIAVYPDHGGSYEELYGHADIALRRSQEQGSNLATLYTED